MVVYMGIDPGINGGIAKIRVDGVKLSTSVQPMFTTPRELWGYLDTAFGCDRKYVCIEQVQGYIGGKGEPGSAMFKFGQSYGLILMGLTATGVEYELITPQVWQRTVGVSPRKAGEGKGAFKARLRARAKELYPNTYGLTLKTCDAILIAHYCYLLNTQKRGRL